MKRPIELITTADEARNMAINWQSITASQDMSYYELAEWQLFFEELATKFNLIEEFKENGII